MNDRVAWLSPLVGFKEVTGERVSYSITGSALANSDSSPAVYRNPEREPQRKAQNRAGESGGELGMGSFQPANRQASDWSLAVQVTGSFENSDLG